MVDESHRDTGEVLNLETDESRVELTTFDKTSMFHHISDEKLYAMVNKAQPWQWDVFLLSLAITIGFLQNVVACAVAFWGEQPHAPSSWDIIAAAMAMISAGVSVVCLITALSNKNSAKKMLAEIRGRAATKREIGAP